jgi:hypothetical protein
MANEIEAARVVTRFTTAGKEDVKQDLRDNERATEQSQRRLDQLAQRQSAVQVKGLGKVTPEQLAQMSGLSLQQVRQTLGGGQASNIAARAVAPSPVSSMIAGMTRGAKYQPESMIERLSAFTAQERNEAKEKLKADAEAKNATREEVKQKTALGKETEKLGKAFGAMGKLVGTEALTGLRLAGLGGVFGAGTIAGTVAGIAGASHRFGGMANPGAAFRFERAMADAEASLGRGLTPTLNFLTQKIRQTGDIIAGNESGIRAFMFNAFIKPAEMISEFTGFNAAADANKGKSIGAALHPLTGKSFGLGKEFDLTIQEWLLTHRDDSDAKKTAAEKAFEREKAVAAATRQMEERSAQLRTEAKKRLGDGWFLSEDAIWKEEQKIVGERQGKGVLDNIDRMRRDNPARFNDIDFYPEYRAKPSQVPPGQQSRAGEIAPTSMRDLDVTVVF